MSMEALLGSPGVWSISRLRIQDVDNCINSPNGRDTLKAAASSPRVNSLELYNCGMSLEGFLLNDRNRNVFRNKINKVRVLEVTGIGNIDGGIMDADLKSLKLERLQINMKGNEEEVIGLDQLVGRGVITRAGFKYLVFRNIQDRNRQEILKLRNKLGTGRWPVILMSSENTDYVRVCRGSNYYELR